MVMEAEAQDQGQRRTKQQQVGMARLVALKLVLHEKLSEFVQQHGVPKCLQPKISQAWARHLCHLAMPMKN